MVVEEGHKASKIGCSPSSTVRGCVIQTNRCGDRNEEFASDRELVVRPALIEVVVVDAVVDEVSVVLPNEVVPGCLSV